MDVEPWVLWMIVAGVFVLAEVFTAGFFIICFGVGALFAAATAYLGYGSGPQWGLFIVVSAVSAALTRRFADRFSKKQPGIGADRLIGKVGVVLERVDNMENTGRIRLDKEEWRADSATKDAIEAGSKVEVRRVDGTRLVVETIKEG